jgi:hypothetical protein
LIISVLFVFDIVFSLNTTTITKFEQLPNELILVCFDYFDLYQLYEIFYYLNERFKKLILHQAKLYINLNSIPNPYQ